MTEIEELKVVITASTDKFKEEMGKANNQIKDSTNQINQHASSISSTFKKVGAVIASAFAIKEVVGFGKDCIKAASDVEEMQNKFDVVFNGMNKEVTDWANNFAHSIGRNKNVIKGYLADNQNLLVGMGMTREEGAKLSENMISLALDLASFNNLNEDDAVNAMSKALMGETESAKSLGAVLNENTRAMAMEQMGLKGKFESLDEATKMEVNYQAILLQSKDAVGDCERSLNSYKGRQIQLNSAIQEIKETIGGKLLPVATNVLTFIADKAPAVCDIVEKGCDIVGQAIGELLEIIQPITDLIETTLNDFCTGFSDNINTLDSNSSSALSNIRDSFNTFTDTIKETWNTIGKDVFNEVGDSAVIAVDVVKNNLPSATKAFNDYVSAISSIWTNLLLPIMEDMLNKFDIVKKKIEDNLPEMSKDFKGFVDTVDNLWNSVLKPILDAVGAVIQYVLLPIWKFVFEQLATNVENNFRKISAFWNDSFKPILDGICNFISGVFSGNWQKAWEGLRNIVSGVFSGLVDIIKLPLQGIIDIWNKTIAKINVKIPSWSPVGGGKSFGVPSIPNIMENGGVLEKGQTGFLEGNGAEAVVPLEKNTGWINKVADKFNNVGGSNGNSDRPLNIMFKVGETEFAKVCCDSLNSLADKNGYIPINI